MRTWAMAVMAVLAAGAIGVVVAAEQARNPLVGKASPEIEAQYWINSDALTLKGLQGKVVVVEFWATWCPPCRASIPHLIGLSKKYADKGVVFIGLTDEPKDKVEPFAKEMKMTYAIGGGSPTGKAYGVTGVPTAFIVDTGGTIAWAGHPLASAFEKALDEQTQKVKPEPKK